MSLKRNYSYIRDWVLAHFLKKTDVDLTQYPTHEEVSDIYASKEDLNDYLSLDQYSKEEEIIAASLTDLDNRFENLSDNDSIMGEDEEKVIAYVLTDFNNKIENKENTTNKVTLLSSSATDVQYPSAKCVYDRISAIENRLSQLEQNQSS